MEKSLYPLPKGKCVCMRIYVCTKSVHYHIIVSKGKLTKPLYSSNQKTEIFLYLLHARDPTNLNQVGRAYNKRKCS